MTEGSAIAELEKLLGGLPDDEARNRVLDWARSRYGLKATAPAGPDWSKKVRWPTAPMVNPAPWPTPAFIEQQPQRCAFDGLPPGIYGMVCTCPKCSVWCETGDLRVFTLGGGPATSGITIGGTGPGMPDDVVFHS